MAALSACLLVGCGRSEAPAAAPAPAAAADTATNLVRVPPDSPQMRQIRVAAVEQIAMPADELVAPARVAINPNRISRVLPPVGGRVLRVLVKFGDRVEQGQTLVTLDSPDADAAVSAFLQAVSTERQTKAALQKSDGDLRRAVDRYEHRASAVKVRAPCARGETWPGPLHSHCPTERVAAWNGNPKKAPPACATPRRFPRIRRWN